MRWFTVLAGTVLALALSSGAYAQSDKAVTSASPVSNAAKGSSDKTASDKVDASTKAENARIARISEGLKLLKAKQPDQIIALMDQNLVEYDMLYADNPNVYCTDGATEALVTLTLMQAADKKAGRKRNISAIGPGWCMSMWLKAFVLIDKGQGAVARQLLEKAVERAPVNPQYQCELGYLVGQMGEPQKSYELYKNAESMASFAGDKADFWRAKAMFGEGYALIDLKRLDEAEAKFKALLELDPTYEKARNELKFIAEQRAAKH